MVEHAVIVRFKYAANDLQPLYDLEDRLENAIIDADVGEFDGNEIAVDLSDGSLYMYGPDAEALFDIVEPLLAAATCLKDARVTLRFGPPEEGTPERVVELNS